MTHEEKTRLLEQSVIESNEGFPGTQLIVTPSWAQIITPNAKGSASNVVYRSILSDAEAAGKVHAVCEAYEALEVPYRWVVTPLTRPVDTSALLEARGLKLLYEATAMFQTAEAAISPIDPALTIQEIGSEQADVYIDTFMQCWELPPAMKTEFSAGVRFGLSDKDKKFRPYVAFLNGEPIATAALLLLPSGGYLASGTVRKDLRRRGIYKAMLSHRAQVALSLGIGHLLIHAKNLTSMPICRKLGFESVYQHLVYASE